MRTTSISRGLLSVLLALAAGPLAAGTECRISGTVVDADGKPIRDVLVMVRSAEVELQYDKKTDKKGQFALMLVDATRPYFIRLQKEGYQPVQEQLELEIGGTVRKTWTLLAGDAAEEPVAEAPAAAIDASNKVARIYNEGLQAYDADDLETALARFEQAAELAPELPEVWTGLSLAFLRLGRHEEAASAADQLAAINPDEITGLRVQYEAHRALGNKEREATALARLIELDPGAATARRVFNAGVDLLRAEKTAAAIARFEEAAAMDPDLAPTHAALASLYLNDGRHADAAGAAERATTLEPDKTETWAILYLARRLSGQPDQADDAFERMSAGDSAFVGGPFLDYGVEFFNRGEVAEARAIFERVLGVSPDHPKAHYYLALCLLNAGDTAGAKARLQKFLELAPEDPEAPVAREMLQSM